MVNQIIDSKGYLYLIYLITKDIYNLNIDCIEKLITQCKSKDNSPIELDMMYETVKNFRREMIIKMISLEEYVDNMISIYATEKPPRYIDERAIYEFRYIDYIITDMLKLDMIDFVKIHSFCIIIINTYNRLNYVNEINEINKL